MGAGMAAAAALALAFWLWPSSPGPASPALAATERRFDIDDDGVIDMLDALALARAFVDGRGRDINGDGASDRRDIDAIAMRAVSLREQS